VLYPVADKSALTDKHITRTHRLYIPTTILVKGLRTLYTFANIWSFYPPPPPHPLFFVHGDSSKVGPLFQHWLLLFFFGGGAGLFSKLNNDFPPQNNASPVGILSSVSRTFGQDFPNETFQKDTILFSNISLLLSLSINQSISQSNEIFSKYNSIIKNYHILFYKIAE